MVAPNHTRSVLAAFQSGEQRLIFARVLGADPTHLVELPQGEAGQWRERARRELLCPVPDCNRPQLKTVARAPLRRDGFSHQAGAGGHSKESLFHLQGKARVAQWLRQRHPDFEVVIEQSSDRSRSRIADVMATAPSGQRYAFEVQYAALSPEAWRARDQSYLDQRIIPIWLFGHHGAQLRSRPGSETDVLLTPVQLNVRAARRTVVWLNPLTAELGYAANEHPTFGWCESGNDGVFATELLENAWLDESGLRSPTLDLLVGPNQRMWDLEDWKVAAAEKQARAAVTAAEDRARRDAEVAERYRQRMAAEARAYEDERARSWARPAARRLGFLHMMLDEQPRALARYITGNENGQSHLPIWHGEDGLPPWLTIEQDHDLPAIPTPQWRAMLHERYIAQPFGTVLNRGQMSASLAARTLTTPYSQEYLRLVIEDWCKLLAEHGQIYQWTDEDGRIVNYAFGPQAEPDIGIQRCRYCGKAIESMMSRAGYDHHPACKPPAPGRTGRSIFRP